MSKYTNHEIVKSDLGFANALTKVPELTFGFWLIKIMATTLGETAGDAVSMTLNFGYLVSTYIFMIVFFITVTTQIKAKQFRPFLYWTTIVATTTAGTTLADFATRSLGIGYSGGSALLLVLTLTSLAVWYKTLGFVSVQSIHSRPAEMFYWITILFSQTLGTALGDWTADTAGLGYLGAAAIFSGLLLILVLLHYCNKLSKTLIFWSAFIITRPLGAVLGDFLDKPLAAGGLALSRYSASATLLFIMVTFLVIFPQRAAKNLTH